MIEQDGFAWSRRVYYADTDAEGVVYHARYLEFCEQARSEFLYHHNQASQMLRGEYGIGFAVRKATIEYLAPALLDDTLSISVIPTKMTRTRLDMRQEVIRSGKIMAQVDLVLVCVSFEKFAPAAIPDALRSTITTILNRQGEH